MVDPGIFPKVSDELTPQYLSEDPHVLNYRDVDGDAHAQQEIDRLIEAGYLRRFDSWENLKREVGRPILSKLGLITKEVLRPDGSYKTKRRLILDCRRSGVNTHARQSSRILLPMPRDVAHDVLHLLQFVQSRESVEALVIDLKDAFFQVPLAPEEWKYATASFKRVSGEHIYLAYTRPPQGGRNSPQVWGRIAALLARLLQGMYDPDQGRLQIYVDDPVVLLRGTKVEKDIGFACFILALRVLRWPLAFSKAARGSRFSWIGATFTILADAVVLEAKEQATFDAQRIVDMALRSTTMTLHDLRVLTGKCSHLAGIVPTLRPFLAPFWAVLHHPKPSRAPKGEVWVQQLRPALLWLHALFRTNGNSLRRYLPLKAFQHEGVTVVTDLDASPWGLGATLSINNEVRFALKSAITSFDTEVFGYSIGDSAGQQTWECLALLVLTRHWRAVLANPAVRWVVRSDNMTVLRLVRTLTAHGAGPGLIARELALDWGSLSWRPMEAHHIPGVSNVMPDALSRLDAPEPPSLPAALSTVAVESPILRPKGFYLTLAEAPVGDEKERGVRCNLMARRMAQSVVWGGVFCFVGGFLCCCFGCFARFLGYGSCPIGVTSGRFVLCLSTVSYYSTTHMIRVRCSRCAGVMFSK
eukprot:6492599-Amphidinium_carterae.1